MDREAINPISRFCRGALMSALFAAVFLPLGSLIRLAADPMRLHRRPKDASYLRRLQGRKRAVEVTLPNDGDGTFARRIDTKTAG